MDKSAVDPALVAKIQQKQAEIKESFALLRKTHVVDENASKILQLPVDQLLKKLQSRELSARDVLHAYTAKALEVTEKFNCVTEFIPQASKWASALDAISPESIGPLHGLPVALKEDFDVEGMDTTLGFAKKLYQPKPESAAIVKILLKLGAIPFAKTNVPQSLFSSGSDNPIFGTTVNCLNPSLAPGGSSSGSGCIVAAGGAPFATGSDIGGSLRIPAAFHGICTVRPTIRRLSGKGVLQCVPSVEHIGVPGIIAPDAKTLTMVWKAITENCIQNQYDPLVPPIPWNESIFTSQKKLKIGYFTSLPFMPAFDDVQKTVLAAKAAFESMGHQTVSFEIPDGFRFLRLCFDILLADQGKYLEKVFAGEPISPCLADLMEVIRNPGMAKKIISSRDVMDLTQPRSAADLWDTVAAKKDMAREILDNMERDGIDILLSPAFTFPAVKLADGYGVGMSAIIYTVLWSFVDFPAGVVKFGTETGANVSSYNDEGDPILKQSKVAMEESAGMPINVQLIAPPFKEELVLRMMVELEKYGNGK